MTVDPLVLEIQGNIADFERSLKKVKGSFAQMTDRFEGEVGQMAAVSRRAANQVEQNFRRSNAGILSSYRQLGAQIRSALNVVPFGAGAALGGVAGIAGGLSIGAGLVELQRATQEVRDLAAEAERAGIAFEAFQELRFVARLDNVSFDALTDGLKELQLRADEFIVTGKGPAAEAFARLGFSAGQLAEALKQPDQLFVEIIDRLGEFDRAAQIRIADEIFGGTGGEQFVQMIERGGAGIEEARQRARELGAVMDRDVAERAREVNERFLEVGQVIEGRVNAALINTGYWTLEIGDRISGWVTALDGFVRALNQAGNSDLFRNLNEFLSRNGLLEAPEGVRLLDPALIAAAQEELEIQKAIAGELEQRLAKANENARLAEAEGATNRLRDWNALIDDLNARLESTRGKIAEIAASIGSASSGMAGLSSISGRVSGGSEPPTGTIPASDAARMLEAARRSGVDTENLAAAAAQGAAKALMDAQFSNVTITSGYRSPEHNARVGGASNSLHLRGMAVDFAGFTGDAQRLAFARALAAQGARGFGWYPNGSLHADWRDAWSFWGTNAQGGSSYSSYAGTPQAFQDFARQMTAGGPPVPGRRPNQIDGPLDRRDQAEALKAENEQLERRNELLAEAEELRQRNLTADEEYAAGVERANELLREGVITQQEYNRELERLAEVRDQAVPALEEIKSAQEALRQASEAVGQALLSTFLSIVDGSEDAGEALRRLALQLAQMVLQGALFGSGPLGGLFGGGLFGAIFGKADGGIVRAAGGGLVSGPGTSRSDSIPAMLSDGEYVVNAAAVQRAGVPFMDALNAGRLPGLATGGVVGRLPRLPSMAGTGSAGAVPLRLELTSRFTADGGFETAVERASRPVARQESARAAGAVARSVPAMVDARSDERQLRRTRPLRPAGLT